MTTACSIAHDILRRALSGEAVIAGTTTTEDVAWWLRARVQELGTHVWFHPTVSVQRLQDDPPRDFSARPGTRVIRPHDLVHIDFGIVWDGLCTDQQQHGFVLGGEAAVPEWADAALAVGNELQDILLGQFRAGRTGNEVLRSALTAAATAGIAGSIYTHPIGIHGHGAGPSIGLWDNQEHVPGPGDRSLRANTAWSIELKVDLAVPQWGGQTVSIMLEEDAWFDGEAVEYLDGRQKQVWPIG